MSYSIKVLDHYENPRNVGSFGKEEDGVATGIEHQEYSDCRRAGFAAGENSLFYSC